MIKIKIEDIVKEKCPKLRIATIECPISNSEYSSDLWDEIHSFEKEFRSRYRLEDISKIPAIHSTRQAYKIFGKEPNRYRPSAEALCRRIIRNLPLYQINTAVDLINLLSLKTGHSIGGFDADLIRGNPKLGIGQEGEIFHAIGRGLLNIQHLPVYRDETGGIGTPTSDEGRTKLSLSTSRLFLIINAYSGEKDLLKAVNISQSLLSKYLFQGDISNFEINLY